MDHIDLEACGRRRLTAGIGDRVLKARAGIGDQELKARAGIGDQELTW